MRELGTRRNLAVTKGTAHVLVVNVEYVGLLVFIRRPVRPGSRQVYVYAFEYPAPLVEVLESLSGGYEYYSNIELLLDKAPQVEPDLEICYFIIGRLLCAYILPSPAGLYTGLRDLLLRYLSVYLRGQTSHQLFKTPVVQRVIVELMGSRYFIDYHHFWLDQILYADRDEWQRLLEGPR
jgi:hypothetical protein